jgi:hypothetical protein
MGLIVDYNLAMEFEREQEHCAAKMFLISGECSEHKLENFKAKIKIQKSKFKTS